MRLEVLELIQMQMQGIETEENNLNNNNNNNNLNIQSTDVMDIYEGLPNSNTNNNQIEVPSSVTIEDITESLQELRILVSKKGMDSMILGSLLAVPTAMLPLQDVEDNNLSVSEKSDNNSNTNSNNHKTTNLNSPIPSNKEKLEEKKSPSKKRTLQVSELINKMETTTDTLMNQVK